MNLELLTPEMRSQIEGREPKELTLPRDGDKDLRFSGWRLLSVDGKWQQGREQNRWHELTLYVTTGGTLVCLREYVTLWQGEAGTSEAKVCASHDEVMSFFGLSTLAKELYDALGIEAVERVQ